MDNRLSGLVSDKVRKPIIINGKLLTIDGATVLARRERYSVVFTRAIAGGKEEYLDNGDGILDNAAKEFNEVYAGMVGKNAIKDVINFHASVDPFTGAIVMKNGLYDLLLDRGDVNHFHDGKMQFRSEVQSLINRFDKELIFNYFEIYSALFNRRLVASHMPVKIKGHLVAGLFQPLVVRTRDIDCPLELSEFRWFFDFLNTPEVCVEQLETSQETTRGLELSVIAMSDFARKFNVPLMRQLNRKYFLFTLYFVLCGQIDPGFPAEMQKAFRGLFRYIESGRGDTKDVQAFLIECITGIQRARTQLVVR